MSYQHNIYNKLITELSEQEKHDLVVIYKNYRNRFSKDNFFVPDNLWDIYKTNPKFIKLQNPDGTGITMLLEFILMLTYFIYETELVKDGLVTRLDKAPPPRYERYFSYRQNLKNGDLTFWIARPGNELTISIDMIFNGDLYDQLKQLLINMVDYNKAAIKQLYGGI